MSSFISVKLPKTKGEPYKAIACHIIKDKLWKTKYEQVFLRSKALQLKAVKFLTCYDGCNGNLIALLASELKRSGINKTFETVRFRQTYLKYMRFNKIVFSLVIPWSTNVHFIEMSREGGK